MRFCMVTTFYPPYHFGGDALYVEQLANELAERGHTVDVVHCLDAHRLLARREPAPPKPGPPNLTVHSLQSRFGFLACLATQQTGKPVFMSRRLKEILEQAYDVIHYHNISLIGGPGVLAYGSALKLYTLHEYWLLCPTHMHFKFDREVCESQQCIACTIVHRRPPQLWRYTRLLERAAANVDVFIAPSGFTRVKHRAVLGDARIEQLPYFTSRWPGESRHQARSSGSRPYVLFVGRLEKVKGLQTLVEPFRNYPDAELWVAGTGDYEEQLRRQARGCSNIRFLGFQAGDDLRRLFREAVAVVVPSIWEEVFGIIILEAFSQQTPVIVRRRGGMPEIIDTSGGGYVYDTDQELMDAVSRLTRDPGLRDKLGRRGHAAFQRHWTAEAHIRKYLGLIESMQQGEAAKALSSTAAGGEPHE